MRKVQQVWVYSKTKRINNDYKICMFLESIRVKLCRSTLTFPWFQVILRGFAQDVICNDKNGTLKRKPGNNNVDVPS